MVDSFQKCIEVYNPSILDYLNLTTLLKSPHIDTTLVVKYLALAAIKVRPLKPGS